MSQPLPRTTEPKTTASNRETTEFLQTVGALRALSDNLDSRAMAADVDLATYMMSQAVRESAQRLARYVSLEHPANV